MKHYFLLIKVTPEGVFIDEDSEYGASQFQAFLQECYNKSMSDLPFTTFAQATQANLFRRDQYPAKMRMNLEEHGLCLHVMNISHEDWELGTDFNQEMIQLKKELGVLE